MYRVAYLILLYIIPVAHPVAFTLLTLINKLTRLIVKPPKNHTCK